MKLPGSTDHVFTIVGDEGRARILHAWQNQHGVRAERSMPIEDMFFLLRELPKYDYSKPREASKVRDVRERLWGSDHRGSVDIGTSSRTRISFNAITSGIPKKPLIECKETLGRLSLDLCEWHSVSSGRSSVSSGRSTVSSTEWHSVVSGRSSGASSGRSSVTEAHGAIRVRYAAGFGAALGFVLGAGGALYNHADWEEVVEEGFKTGLAVGVGEGVGAVVAKSVTPTIAKAGISVVRANAAAGAAMFGVFALWDVAKWAKHDITAVELRKNLTEGAAGAAGGVAGGVALGAAGGAAFGPPGAIIGGIIGGIAGGFGGAAAGKAIDKAIWDEGEDSVMNSYEFFGWHDVDRGKRPTKSARAIAASYLRKLDDKPSKKIKNKDWATYCTANLMVLLRAMFPEFKTMLKISEDLRNNSSKAISIIGSAMYSSTLVSSSSISTPGTKEVLDGIYFIENVATQRYVFQDGDPIRGERGDERGWLAHSGFESPKVVGSDANYYNRAYWNISHQGDGKHFIENLETKRYLFQDGEPIQGDRGEECGWLAHSGYQSPKAVGADANYYNRAYWYILRQSNGEYFIENVETRRYLFQDGDPIQGKRGAEGGWLAHSGFESPNMVGADANYYNRAYFRFTKFN